MPIPIVADISSTELNKTSGKVLDTATNGPVRVRRRDQRFVVLLEDDLNKMLEAARENRPESLADMLKDYDPEKIRNLTTEFMEAPAAGREML